MQQDKYKGQLAVVYNNDSDYLNCQQLAERLAVPLYESSPTLKTANESCFLSWRDDCLKLFDKSTLKKGGLFVDLDQKALRIKSWPAPRKGPLAQAIGRKTRTVVDATTGWAGDSFLIYSMGCELHCIERSPVMAELLKDGLQRFSQLDLLTKLRRQPMHLSIGNAIEVLANLPEQPDCIYIDPMFPPKRKESALAKKSMVILRDLLGDDEDKDQLLSVALAATNKRVVVKMPDYASPLGREPDESFKGKLLRYDVYLVS